MRKIPYNGLSHPIEWIAIRLAMQGPPPCGWGLHGFEIWWIKSSPYDPNKASHEMLYVYIFSVVSEDPVGHFHFLLPLFLVETKIQLVSSSGHEPSSTHVRVRFDIWMLLAMQFTQFRFEYRNLEHTHCLKKQVTCTDWVPRGAPHYKSVLVDFQIPWFYCPWARSTNFWFFTVGFYWCIWGEFH